MTSWKTLNNTTEEVMLMFDMYFTENAAAAGWIVAGILALGLVGVKLLFIHKDKKRNRY